MSGLMFAPFNNDFTEFLKSGKKIDGRNIGLLEENIPYLFGEIDELVMDIPSGKRYRSEKYFATSGQIQPYYVKGNIRKTLKDESGRILKVRDKIERTIGLSGSIIHLDKIVGFELKTDRVINAYQNEDGTKYTSMDAEDV